MKIMMTSFQIKAISFPLPLTWLLGGETRQRNETEKSKVMEYKTPSCPALGICFNEVFFS